MSLNPASRDQEGRKEVVELESFVERRTQSVLPTPLLCMVEGRANVGLSNSDWMCVPITVLRFEVLGKLIVG